MLDESFNSFESTAEERKNRNSLKQMLLEKERKREKTEDAYLDFKSSTRRYIRFNKALSKFETTNQTVYDVLGKNVSKEDQYQFNKFIKDINNYFDEPEYKNLLKKNKINRAIKIILFTISLLALIALVTFGILCFSRFSTSFAFGYFTSVVFMLLFTFFFMKKVQQNKFIEDFNIFDYKGKKFPRVKTIVDEYNETFFHKRGLESTIPISMEFIMFSYSENVNIDMPVSS